MKTTVKSSMHFLGFDGIRFFAALMVIITHAAYAEELEKTPYGWIVRLIGGNNGVSIFFVLSGFLISNLLVREYLKYGSVSIRHFLLRRALRLYPLYYLVVGIIFLMGLSGFRETNHTSLIYALIYSYNFIPRQYYDTWLGSFHTLAVEEHFYIFYPFFLKIFFRNIRTALIAIFLFLMISSSFVHYFVKNWGAEFFVERWTFFAVKDILIGCLIGLIYSLESEIFHLLGRWSGRIGVLFLVSHTLNPNLGLASISYAFLLMFIIKNQNSKIVGFFEFKPFVYFGKASYGLYVWQSFFLTTGLYKISGWPLDREYAIPLVFLATIISWEALEKPVLKLKDRFGYAEKRYTRTL